MITTKSKVFCLIFCAFVLQAKAQMFSVGSGENRDDRILSFNYHLLNFAYDGGTTQVNRFDYEGTALGISYERQNLMLSLMFGSEDSNDSSTNLKLLDASLVTWSGIQLNRSGGVRVLLPVVLFSNYRNVNPERATAVPGDAFNITTLGIGSGLVLEGGSKNKFQARVNPIYGLTVQQIGESNGTAWVVDNDFSITLAKLFGDAGLTLGYGLRYHNWDVSASSLFENINIETYDYVDVHHAVRIGISW